MDGLFSTITAQQASECEAFPSAPFKSTETHASTMRLKWSALQRERLMRSFITDPSGKAKAAQLKNHYGEALPPAAAETLPSFALPSCFQFTSSFLSEIVLQGRAEPLQNEVHRGANVMRSAIRPLQHHKPSFWTRAPRECPHTF